MSDEFPPTIGKYKILGIVAKGGMGVVYKAIHPSLKRYVVIKKMTSKGKSKNAERFKKEAQILLDLQSPYIVHLFDYFTEGGFRYMVEELVDGTAVDKLIQKQSSLPCPVAMLILQDACWALKYAHSKNIVHRDIKPGNILISKNGAIKLADFGIASDSEEGDGITQSGVALGTPSYMPPEQFIDSANVDQRADIYALGIMLYEMITGAKPYEYTNMTEMLKTIKKGKYISPRKFDKTIPHHIVKMIKKMTRPKAKHRYPSAEAILKQVKKYLKHYDAHEIRVQLAKSVASNKTYNFAEIKPKDKRRQLIKKIVIITLSVLLALSAAWGTGLIQRTVLSKVCSPVKLEVEMPKSLGESMDLPIRVFFFNNDNDEIPEVNGTRRTLALKGSRFTEKIIALFDKIKGKDVKADTISAKNQIYNMRTVFLKQGDYRVKVVVGPYVWWKSFSVGKDDVLVECEFLKNMQRKLNIKTYAYDRDTNEDITDKVTFNILINGDWVDIKTVDPKKITSGTVWKITAVSEGYVDEYFSLLIDWYQDDISISASLDRKE